MLSATQPMPESRFVRVNGELARTGSDRRDPRDMLGRYAVAS